MVPGEVGDGFSDADLGFSPPAHSGGSGKSLPASFDGLSDADLGFTGKEEASSTPVRTKKDDGDTTDYGSMPWAEVAKRGVMSTPAAVESGAKTAYRLITNPLQTAHGFYDLGHGVVSHVNRWAYDLPPDSKEADILVVATGKPKMITGDMVKIS